MKHSPKFLLMLFVLIALATVAGCRKDDNNPVDGGNAKPSVTTTIAGIVSNESGNGMGNVVVSAYGQTVTTTGSDGYCRGTSAL